MGNMLQLPVPVIGGIYRAGLDARPPLMTHYRLRQTNSGLWYLMDFGPVLEQLSAAAWPSRAYDQRHRITFSAAWRVCGNCGVIALRGTHVCHLREPVYSASGW